MDAKRISSLQKEFKNLEGASISKIERRDDQIFIHFSDGTTLEALYWRPIANGKSSFSSFDDGVKYGLPRSIDALSNLSKLVGKRKLESVSVSPETGDLEFIFEDSVKLQVFNFTGLEIWELNFSNGKNFLSNYVLE